VTNSSVCAFLLLVGLGSFPLAQASSRELVPVSRDMLCVTEGELSAAPQSQLSVNVPKMRAYVNAETTADAEVRFTYLGATAKGIPLGSGEMRRQFGLKLLAQDACNLVYVMWRFEPESKVVVSFKSNLGQHTSSECGNRGYTNIKARHSSKVPAMATGSTHTLQASLHEQDLQVVADGMVVWVGSVGLEASQLRGPAGVRSDNARLNFALQTSFPGGRAVKSGPACRNDAGE
jgi:hypothetical protein